MQPFEQVADADGGGARGLGFHSVNVDLIYGLPQQTVGELRRTLAQVSELRPDRIALYAYAHLPELFKPQRRIADADAARAAAQAGDAGAALSRGLLRRGLRATSAWTTSRCPTTRWPSPKRQGRLHRNFQGYSTQPDCDLIGLGVSAIGKVGDVYAQNAKDMAGYAAAIDRGSSLLHGACGSMPMTGCGATSSLN